MVAKTKASNAPSMGALIDRLWACREEKRRLEEQIKEVEKTIEGLTEAVFGALETNGLDKATGSKASVSVSTNVVADVQDWDAFWAYIIKNKYTHLLQRRVSDPAYRELVEAGKKVPGVQPFPKRKLTLRSL